MRIKWQFAGEESLGMSVIEDRDSAWYSIKPVPRMIQNQLGHLLELNMIDLDKKILKSVQALMEKRERRTWLIATLAIFLLLHVREIDAGRIIFGAATETQSVLPFKFRIGSYSNNSSSGSGYTHRSQRPSLMKRPSLATHYCRIFTV